MIFECRMLADAGKGKMYFFERIDVILFKEFGSAIEVNIQIMTHCNHLLFSLLNKIANVPLMYMMKNKYLKWVSSEQTKNKINKFQQIKYIILQLHLFLVGFGNLFALANTTHESHMIVNDTLFMR